MKTLPLFLLPILLLACTAEKGNDIFDPYDETQWQQAQKIDIGEIDLDVENDYFSEKGTYKFSDLFSKVEYVGLDTLPEAIIGRIEKMIVTEKDEFIFFDQRNASILRFAPDGKFLNRIGQRGHSKREYVDPQCVQYDELSHHLFVTDRGFNGLKEFDLDGHFVRDIKTEFNFMEFGIIDDKYFATFCDLVYPQPGDTAYFINIYDFEGHLVKTHKHPLAIGDWIREHNGIYCSSFYDNPRHFIALFGSKGDIITYIQDKSHPDQKLIKLNSLNDMQGIINSNCFHFAQDDKLYFTYEPESIEWWQTEGPQFCKEHGQDVKDSDIAFLEELSQNKNLIIQICTLK